MKKLILLLFVLPLLYCGEPPESKYDELKKEIDEQLEREVQKNLEKDLEKYSN